MTDLLQPESNANRNHDILKPSPTDENEADTKDKDKEKSVKTATESRYDVTVEQDEGGHFGFKVDTETMCIKEVDDRTNLKSMKYGHKIIALNGDRVSTWDECSAKARELVSNKGTLKFQLTLMMPPNEDKSKTQADSQCNCSWLYEDTKWTVQGPFLSNQMQLWYEHEMLPKELRLRRTTDPSKSFALIVDYFPRPLLPFQSQPVTPAAMRPILNPHDSTNSRAVAKLAKTDTTESQ